MATPTTLPATFVAGNVLTAAQMNDLRGAFRVLQVVQTTKNDTFSTTSTSFVDVTGLTVSITPSSTSSKILVMCSVFGNNQTEFVYMQLVRNSTNIGVPSGGSAPSSTSGTVYQTTMALNWLDSPNTTSATTYKIQARCGSGTAWINRFGFSADVTCVSSITVMEISA